MNIERIGWLGVRTESAKAMAVFLSKTLGLRLEHSDSDQWIFVLPGGGKVEVFSTAAPDKEHFSTGPVAGFVVDDVEAATAELRRVGVPILSGPIHGGDDSAWVHFRAPDGNVYELTQGRDLDPSRPIHCDPM